MSQYYPKTVFPNGLRVVSAPRRESQSVALGFWINAGGRYENRQLNGISHFLEHLLFKGTKSRSSRAIKEAVEGTGGSLNAFTDEEYTCVWAKVQPKALESTVEVMTDMVLNSVFDGKELERERQVILEEIRMYKDLPMQYVHDLLNNLLWPDHPLGMELAGTEKSVARLRREEIRRYHRRFYTPANILVAACGQMSHRELVQIVKRLWRKIPAGTLQKSRKPRQIQRQPRVKAEVKTTEQTHFSLGFHAFPRNHPQVHALNLLNVILGGNMSSRLFQRVREDRGLAYEIGSQIKRFKDTGYFSISAGVEHKHLFKSIDVILREIKRVRREPVSEKEFEQAREYLTGQLLFSLEDTVEQMSWVGECEMTLGEVQPGEKVLDQIHRVKRRDITEVARAILRLERSNLAMIGPLQPEGKNRLSRMLEA